MSDLQKCKSAVVQILWLYLSCITYGLEKNDKASPFSFFKNESKQLDLALISKYLIQIKYKKGKVRERKKSLRYSVLLGIALGKAINRMHNKNDELLI